MNFKLTRYVSAAFLAALLCASLRAEISMCSIFSDNMVLQRGINVRVWGGALPEASVEVAFADAKVSAKADAKGRWVAELPAMKADSTPKKMSVYENGKLGKTISNVLVGEVWIAAGQSNMEWRTAATTDAELVKKTANYPKMRYFDQRGDFSSATPLSDCVGGGWVVATPKSAMRFSAVGFYFAERLMTELDVPVAIVYAALGATPMSAWLPRETLEKSDAFKQDVAEYSKRIQGYDYAAEHSKWRKAVEDYKDARRKALIARQPRLPQPSNFVQNEPTRDDPLGPRKLPAGSFNAKIAPIAGYTVRGVIWYQGESDAYGKRLADFEKDFTILINKWRELWKSPEMPFYFVQLTGYENRNNWAETREAQRKVSQNLKNAKMAVTVDVGERTQIHPRNKKPVGVRLANIALREVYGADVIYPHSPSLKKFSAQSDKGVAEFETGGRALECRGAARGFEVLLPSGAWEPAKASFDGKNVILKSQKGAEIRGARYLWKSWSGDDACIFNSEGLPLAPFIWQAPR